MRCPPSHPLEHRLPRNLPESVCEVKSEDTRLWSQRRVGLGRLGHLFERGCASDAVLPGPCRPT
eukprot:713889-Prorocentrum_lima.AAC.1